MGVIHDVDEPVLEVLDRVARAKEVLRRAEERTGARTLRIVATGSDGGAQPGGAATPDAVTRQDLVPQPGPEPGPAARANHPDLARRAQPARQAWGAPHSLVPHSLAPHDLAPHSLAPHDLPGGPALATDQTRPARGAQLEPLTREQLSSNDRPPLPVPPSLREILPDGLRRGSITVVSGSTSLLLSLVAEASQAGSWAALVGAPSINLLAAAQAGVDLSRLVLVPGPGIESATTVAALLDGMDLVVVGPEVALVDSDRRRLAARARERASVVLTMRPWQGAGMTLTAERSRWSGLGAGYGRLSSRLLTVTRSGRSGAGVPLSRELWLPLETTAVPSSAMPSSGMPSAPVPSAIPSPAAPVSAAARSLPATASPLAQVG